MYLYLKFLTMKENRLIKDTVGETLLIPLYMKCRESQKENPILNDPMACKLVSEIEYDFDKFKKGKNSSVGVAIRAHFFDECTIDFIKNHQTPIVLLVGCGLDTRYHRIGKWAEKAVFYELDIPEVMQIREKLLPPAENQHYISASMFETAWMDEIKEKHPTGEFLIIIEGVLMYFKKEEIKLLFDELAKRFRNTEVYFDLINVWMSKNSHLHDTVKLTNATFNYGTDDDKVFEKWNSAWEYQSTKLFSDFKAWKRVGFIFAYLLPLIPQFKTSGKMLHYKIK